MQGVIRGVVVAFLLCAPVGAARAETGTGPLDAMLEGIESGWQAAGLRAWANAEGVHAFRLGEDMSFFFESKQDASLLVLHRDSHGVAHLLVPSPLASEPRIAAGQRLAIEGLEAIAPVGADRIYAIATRKPLDLGALELGSDDTELRTFDRDAALALAKRLSTQLASLPSAQVAVAKIDYRIVGRGEIEYTVGDVVAQLIPTRSVPRPKMDFRQVVFASDSAELTEKARQNLDVLGQALQSRQLSAERFVLAGHTDDKGAPEYNKELSQRRAASAREYLYERWGIERSRVEARGYGEERPAVPNENDEARAFNRRVELEVIR